MSLAVLKLAELYRHLSQQSDANVLAKLSGVPSSIMRVYRQPDWYSRYGASTIALHAPTRGYLLLLGSDTIEYDGGEQIRRRVWVDQDYGPQQCQRTLQLAFECDRTAQ